MQAISIQEEALRLREQKLSFADIADHLGLTMSEVIGLLQDSVHAQAAERRRAPKASMAATAVQDASSPALRTDMSAAKLSELNARLGAIAEQLGCEPGQISQAVEDLIEALDEESERREAAEARIAHVERGRFEAVEELLKARRELRIERERLAGTPAAECDDDKPRRWSAWMRPSQLADGLGLARSLVSKAAINKQGAVAGRAIEVRRRLTAEERAANPGSRYLIRYELLTEESAQ